ncbi:MAG TPA: metallophosphoesterase, partial [Polyangiaceae bacterium]|nr:metallophosphoesterase [Polyangiaceae bacterium]
RGDTTVLSPPGDESASAGESSATETAASASPAAAAPASGSLAAAGSGGGGSGAGGTSATSSGAGASAQGGAPARISVPGRLIAIGDLHGDVDAARAALRLGGAIDDSDRWVGENLSVVQTGDQLDRGDHEREIVDLFTRLGPAAAARGGRVVPLNGNHEVMNVQGDFRYVTPGGLAAFTGVSPRSPLARSAPAPYAERAAAFFPGGAYALELAQRDVIAIVGDSVFVHGGVLPAHVRYGIDRINQEARQWMQEGGRAAPDAVAGEGAPIWVRDYSLDPVSDSACSALGEVLSALGARRMVVGHTVQRGGISSACGDRVYRIDVGLSRYYGGPLQVLEIDGEQVRVLSATRAP